MPSPYDLIQRAKQQKKEDGNKRADKWATLQVNTSQNTKPVVPVSEQPNPPTAAPPPPGPPRAVRSTPNIDAIHKRHEQAVKNANWQKLEPPKEEGKT